MIGNAQRIVRTLVVAAVVLAGAVMVLVSAIGFDETRDALTQARAGEADAVIRGIRHDIDRAVGFGVPLTRIGGMTDYLAQRAARAHGVRFLAVTGPDGRRLYAAGLDDAVVDRVLAALPPGATAVGDEGLSGEKTSGPFAALSFVVVAAPLHDRAGTVLAGVEPDDVDEALTADIGATLPYWLGCLALVGLWARVAGRAALVEPLERLTQAVKAAAHGRFGELLVRRARDPVGRCLLAFNAVVAGLFGRRQNFVAQAEEVRHAVFEAEVADRVTATRDQVLATLGDGLESPPVRCFDHRGGDADLFAIAAIAAGTIGLADALFGGRGLFGTGGWLGMAGVSGEAALAGGAAFLVAVLSARPVPAKFWLVSGVTVLVLVALRTAGFGAPEMPASGALLAGVSGWAAGAGAGISRCRHLAFDPPEGGGRWLIPVVGSFLAGLAIAWSLEGDRVTGQAITAALAAVATVLAAVTWHDPPAKPTIGTPADGSRLDPSAT